MANIDQLKLEQVIDNLISNAIWNKKERLLILPSLAKIFFPAFQPILNKSTSRPNLSSPSKNKMF
jgi:hypothetical protein